MTVDTTAPRASRSRSAAPRAAEAYGFVVLKSRKESHRRGEIAFVQKGVKMFFGRTAPRTVGFIYFLKQLPGRPIPPDPGCGSLAGESLSRVELELDATDDGIAMKVVGRNPVLVNDEVVTSALLVPGDTVLFEGEVLLLVVKRALVMPALKAAVAAHTFGEADLDGYVGESPLAWKWRDDVASVAGTNDHVKILGETGTGKELTAAAIHRLSRRAKAVFVSVNAATLPKDLAEAELFGNLHNFPNPGMLARKGLFGTAHLGTFFLDEIAELPLPVQTKCLRSFDKGEFRSLGEAMPRYADVRVIAATSQSLGTLRDDFEARFEETIRTAPLRERPEDIPFLVRAILRRRLKEQRGSVRELRFYRKDPSTGEMEPEVSDRFLAYLVRQPFHRNMRDLRAILNLALRESSGDVIELPDSLMTTLPSETDAPGTGTAVQGARELEASAVVIAEASGSEGETAAQVEGVERSVGETADPTSALPETDEGERRASAGPYSRAELVAILEKHRWNFSAVAEAEGVHRNTVARWARAHGVGRG